MKLKELRLESGLNAKDFADKIKIEYSKYWNWESGRSKPDYLTIIKLANYFNVSTDYLLGLTDEKTPPKITKEAEMLKSATPEQIQTVKTILQLNANELGEVKGYASALLNRTKKPFEEI